MSDKYIEFVNLIKYVIYGGDIPTISDWNGIAIMLEDHLLVPLLGNKKRINNLKIPRELYVRFTCLRMNQIRDYEHIKSIIDEMTTILGENELKPVIIKGLSAAKYYDEPALRATRDIDFLMKEARAFDKAKGILIRNGYSYSEGDKDPDYSYMRHDDLERDGVRIEMHRFFSRGKNSMDGEIDDTIVSASIDEALVGECRFYSLQDSINGLVLIDHINHHLETGLGMRQIIDWVYYVEKILSDELWDKEFRDIVRRSGLETLTITVTRMCEMYLGLSHRVFAEGADEDICSLLLEEILEAGDFGKSRDHLVNKIVGFSNSKSFFVRLQEGGVSNWHAFRKHKWLRPFAWIYQAFRLFGITIRNIVSHNSITGVRKLVDRHDILTKGLKIGKYR